MTPLESQRESRRSLRLRDYDYSRPGAYYLTFVAFQRECLFGDITNGKMTLSQAGIILRDVWHALPDRYPNVILDQMSIMPNHFHGILYISGLNNDEGDVGIPVAAIHELPLQEFPERESSEEYRIRRRRMLIPRLVGFIKMNSAKAINILLDSGGRPVWQRNYYEHVIRTDAELERVRNYIYYNPQQWGRDEENDATDRDSIGL